MNLLEELKNYTPFNLQEEKDLRIFQSALEKEEEVFTRKNTSLHFSASSWIVNQDFTQILMIYHNIYDSWSWTGGHCDGQQNTLKVALEEAKEETGLKEIEVLDKHIFSIETLAVDNHIKNGLDILPHLHLNVTYLLMANDTDLLKSNPKENKGVRWFSRKEALEVPKEEWMKTNVYQKLDQKLSIWINEKNKGVKE